MNIVYISALEGGKYSGPLHSVPKQLYFQNKIDNIYWVNLTNIEFKHKTCQNLYHYIKYSEFSIEKLPIPFCKPDIVIFEEFFKIECCIVAKKLEKKKVPYIIVPRCQMTEKYLQNKFIKKRIARILMFNHFAKKSLAVQFLSQQEFEDSRKFYQGKSAIIPNGIDLEKKCLINKEKSNQIHCLFIGRYSIWQKGLDLLIQAISNVSKELNQANIKFDFYGPDERTGNRNEIEELIKKNNVTELITVNGPIFDDEKKEVLQNADLFIHTSRFEGLPMAVLEAISYGIPCIVTKGSNLKEKIEEANAGWGCDTEQKEIEKTLIQVISELELIDEKRKNAINLAKEYSWHSIAKQTHKWYEDLLKEEI